MSTALVLAAHGSREEPAANEVLRRHAVGLGARESFSQVEVAFHGVSPSFAEVFDGLAADRVVVVPVLASRGYYCDVVLPRELGRRSPPGSPEVRLTDPVGVHPKMARLVLARLRHLRGTFSLTRPAVAMVGHGTDRHPASGDSTRRVARDLDDRQEGTPCRALFLDQEPYIEEIKEFALGHDLVVIPFLMTSGRHATADVLRRAIADREVGSGPPFVAEGCGRRVVVDRPIGEDAGIGELIADLASRELASAAWVA